MMTRVCVVCEQSMSHDTVDKMEGWSGATRIMSPRIGIAIGGEERRWKGGLFLFLDSSKTRSRL